jgi:hypothetical protein
MVPIYGIVSEWGLRIRIASQSLEHLPNPSFSLPVKTFHQTLHIHTDEAHYYDRSDAAVVSVEGLLIVEW